MLMAFQRLGVSGAVWIAVVVVAQELPLVQLLSYEYAILLNLLLLLVWAPRTIARRGAATPVASAGAFWGLALRLGVSTMPWLLGSVAVSLLNAFRVRNCAPIDGLSYALVFGVGAAPLIVALLLVAERIAAGWQSPWVSGAFAPRWRVVAVYGVLVLLSACGTLAWLALQPPLVVYDLFGGFYAASIYDEAMLPWHAHLAYRGFTVVVAVAWVGIMAFERRQRAVEGWVVGASLLAMVGVWQAEGDLGIARSRTYIEEMLGGVIANERFKIHYDVSAFSKEDLVQLVADHEARYAELERFWGVTPRRQLRSYIYGSYGRRAQAMGGSSTMIARVWLGEMHLVWQQPTSSLLAHEMSHLFLEAYGYGPLRLASRHGILPLMGLVEGSATAAAWDADELSEHGWAAAIDRLALIESPADALSAAAFWSQSSGVVYTLWGSFSRWLIDRHGPATFLAMYRRGDVEGAYGQTLDALLAQWQQFLRGVPLTDAQLGEASLRFSRMSLLRRQCGRAIATLENDADDAIARRDFAHATQCIERLLESERGDPSLRFRSARRLEWMDLDAAAVTILRALEGSDDAGPALRQQARLRLADAAWRAEDRATAAQWLDAVERNDPMSETVRRHAWVRRQLIEQRAQFPNSERAGRRYLASPWAYRPSDMQMDLLVAALEEESIAAAWLAFLLTNGSSLGAAADTLAPRLAQADLPEGMHRRFELERARGFILRGDRRGCRLAGSLIAGTEGEGDGIAAAAKHLVGRCEAPGLYLDAARSAVE